MNSDGHRHSLKSTGWHRTLLTLIDKIINCRLKRVAQECTSYIPVFWRSSHKSYLYCPETRFLWVHSAFRYSTTIEFDFSLEQCLLSFNGSMLQDREPARHTTYPRHIIIPFTQYSHLCHSDVISFCIRLFAMICLVLAVCVQESIQFNYNVCLYIH